jgi:oligopeptidase B
MPTLSHPVFAFAARLGHVALCALSLGLLLPACTTSPDQDTKTMPADVLPQQAAAPIAKRVESVISSPHGDRVDHYQWLRDDARKNPDMLAYLTAENDYKAAYFARLNPLVETLNQEMRSRIKEDDSSVPIFEDGYWYYARYSEGQQYPIYARRKGSMDAAEQVLLDGNAMVGESAYFSIGNYQVTRDGNTLAYATDFVGRRQYTIEFKDLQSGKALPGKLENVSGNMVWAGDNQTLFFVKMNEETLLPYQLYRYRLGQSDAKPELIYEEKDTTFYTAIGLSKSKQFLLLFMSSTLTDETRVLDANTPNGEFKTFRARERGLEYSIDHMDGQFYIRTNLADAAGKKSDNFRLMRVRDDAAFANTSLWQDVVPHDPKVLLEGFELFQGKIALERRSEGLRKISVLDLASGKNELIQADDPSYVMNINSTPDLSNLKLRYRYDSLTAPGSVLELDLQSGERRVLKQDPILGRFNASDYQSQYRQAKARDGTLVPVSIVYKKTTALDGSAPLYVYSYGSYGSSTEPYFSSNRLSLLDRGFVFAIAHIRGGQEMGRAWYEGGKLLQKKNTFTDFIDVTQYLVDERFGAKDRVFAMGGSAGGLLMGAVVNMAPEKYRGVVAHVPFVDVVTTMLDESIPLTTGEFDEWGNPKDKAYYDYMLSYSPYDQVTARAYPAMLVTTGLHDSQVQYWEPAKWVAKLRHLKTDSNPLLFKVNMEAGHGGRSGRFDRLKEVAEEYAFIIDLAKR